MVTPDVRASTRAGTFTIRSHARTDVADEGQLPDRPGFSDLVMLGSSLWAADGTLSLFDPLIGLMHCGAMGQTRGE